VATILTPGPLSADLQLWTMALLYIPPHSFAKHREASHSMLCVQLKTVRPSHTLSFFLGTLTLSTRSRCGRTPWRT
jgi:hypothetical protein